ncbi:MULTISPECIES: GDP-L-fucose synthase family protein [unclassified Bradyrhizobium]|uniref:GDP-L-fucose synthase family protein n=1 Tax=unclassified Bradyrhizobium TaxID=2631580 RepID=UPI0028ECA74E|nr:MULTISPECIES: NAD-dependent epimerase/dehydratase family protein [unclassified Bradyrhizobium]
MQLIVTADHLAQMIGVANPPLMLMEVAGLTRAIYGEKSAVRLAHQNGCRDRTWETRAGAVELHISKFARAKPQVVVLAAAKVGGIVANNTLRAEFIYDNIAIATNVIHAAHVNGAEKLIFLGSSCIYPKLAPQPLHENAMLTGPLEPTNEPYAIAKIAGIKMVEAYRSQYGADFINVMPTNLYGPGDNYHPEYSHVVAALIRRFHEAKLADAPEVVVWGTGTPRREFLYVDDMADACVHLMKTYSDTALVNIGTGKDIAIADFARVVAAVVGFKGSISFDRSRPDGTPRKLLDVSRLTELGWRATTSQEVGVGLAYQAFLREAATQ